MNPELSNPAWKPTLTMAKLFEMQNQYYDALVIYEIISQTDDSPQVREKIADLQARILNDPNMRYDSRIEKLFSPEELAYLKIMNHSAFENLNRLKEQFVAGASDYEVVLEEDEPTIRPTVSSYEVRRMVEEINTLAEPEESQPEQAAEPVPEPEFKSEQEEEFSDRFITATEEIEPLTDKLDELPGGFRTVSDDTEPLPDGFKSVLNKPELQVEPEPEQTSAEEPEPEQSAAEEPEQEAVAQPEIPAQQKELEPLSAPIEPPADQPEYESDRPKSIAETLVEMLAREINPAPVKEEFHPQPEPETPAETESEPQANYIEPPAAELETLPEEVESITEEIEQPSYEESAPVEQPEPVSEPEEEESTITDLAEELVKHFGKQSKLDAISVQEFMQVVMKHKLQEKTDKPE